MKDISSDDDIKADGHQHIAIVNKKRAVIVIERELVVEAETIPEAFMLFFSLHYALDLQYPPALKTTMEFFQKVVLKLNAEAIPPKLGH